MWGVLLVGITLAVYLRVMSCDFILVDDRKYVYENVMVLRGLNLEDAAWAFTTVHDANWIPLTWLSLMLDATIYGDWPGGFHLTNVLIHAVNVLLLFAIFREMTGNAPQSAFVAAMFAIHPIHVESVAWVAERKDVLSMLFGLLSLWTYVRWTRRGRVWRLELSLVFYLASLMAKQTFVTLPFVFLLLDYWPLGRWVQWRATGRMILEKLPFFAMSALACVITVLAQSSGQGVGPLSIYPLSARVLNAISAYGLYLRKALLPYDLAIFYLNLRPNLRLMTLINVALVFAVLAAVTTFAIANRRRRPYLLVGWLWFLGTLVPMIGLVQVGDQQLADRYAYFPMIGVYAAIAWLVPSLSMFQGESRQRWLRGVAAIVVAIYGAVAFVQVGYWHDTVTVCTHAMAVTTDNTLARLALSQVDRRHAAGISPYGR